MELNRSTVNCCFSVFLGVTKALECWGERRLKGPKRGSTIVAKAESSRSPVLDTLHNSVVQFSTALQGFSAFSKNANVYCHFSLTIYSVSLPAS